MFVISGSSPDAGTGLEVEIALAWYITSTCRLSLRLTAPSEAMDAMLNFFGVVEGAVLLSRHSATALLRDVSIWGSKVSKAEGILGDFSIDSSCVTGI